MPQLPLRYRFGRRAFGDRPLAALLPEIQGRLGVTDLLVAKSMDPRDGRDHVGIFRLPADRPPQLAWDGFLLPDESRTLVTGLATTHPVLTGAMETRGGTRRWQFLWTQPWEPAVSRHTTFQLFDRRGRLAACIDGTLVLDRATQRLPVTRIDHLYAGISDDWNERWLEARLHNGDVMPIIRQTVRWPMSWVEYDGITLLINTAWLRALGTTAARDVGVSVAWHQDL